MSTNDKSTHKNYEYYKVKFKLIEPMLGTATDASIWEAHVIQRAKTEISKANRLGTKINKALEKYKGTEITVEKEVAELQGVMRSFLQLLGKPLDVPSTVDELLELNSDLRDEFEEELKGRTELKATVFMKNAEGWPIISSHMILGNLKENAKISTNSASSDDKKLGVAIYSSKVSVGESMALDVKPVESFMKPSNDILRVKSQAEFQALPTPGKGKYILDGTRVILERPISFERMGKRETAIAMSELLPKGTEFGTILRIRTGSKITEDSLRRLFDLGKNNGFGSWRGSGNMGAYVFQLEKVEYTESHGDGWE